MNAPTTTRVSRLLALLEQYGPMPFGDLRELLPDVKDTVLSAMLSKLKTRGDVDRCEKGWFVAESGEEREQPAGDDGEALPPPESEPYRVGDEHPAKTGDKAPGWTVKPQPNAPVPNPDEERENRERRYREMFERQRPAFVFHVETKSLKVSIEGDEADAIAAIRAVAEALEDQARRAKS